MLHVAEFHQPEKLFALRETWDELWKGTFRRSVFQSWDWFRNILDESRGRWQPRVLLVTLHGKPIGLLPLIQRKVFTPFGTARIREVPETRFALPVEVVGPTPAATWMACLRHLRRRRRDWDVLLLSSDTPAGGRRIENAFRYAGIRCCREERPAAAVLSLEQMRIAHGSRFRFSSDWQQRFLQAEHRLRRFGHLRFVRFSPQLRNSQQPLHIGGQSRWDLYTAFLRAARCPAGATPPSLAEEAGRRAFNVLHEIGTSLRAIDLSLLYVNDRPAAAAYCLNREGELQALRIGRAADCTRDAVDVLLGYLWHDSLRRGDVAFRFPVGCSHPACETITFSEGGMRLRYFHPCRLRARWLQWNGTLSGQRSAGGDCLPAQEGAHPARRRTDSPLFARSPRLTTVG